MLGKQHLPILRRARELLDEGRECLICRAVYAAAGKDEQHLVHDIDCLIEAELEGEPTLVAWVRVRYPVCDHPAWLGPLLIWDADYETRRSMRTLMRMAWLDKLIFDIERP
jgi:hypothetical protein